ncbi:MAG TPA: ABC transporter permease [Planctomycetota bacterium]|nr:ABC transporter permease [Planctomycetota bacterium]
MQHIERSPKNRLVPSHERILAVLLLVEIAVFCVIGRHFVSADNAFELVRLSVEVGLLALAMTPVIVTGGIDLSVGSLISLSAVLFGKLFRDAGLPVGVAAALTLGVGAVAGLLNAALITGLRLPPLIVTLGSFSLFRGLAEGVTGGSDSFMCPTSFLFLGRGAQIPVFVAAAAGFWILLHRSVIGRGLYAIGLSPEGARHAGIPVARRVGLVYVLSGVVASLSALIYVSRYTQARADAGTGYELLAITAVVLGGTSIFGGRGRIPGTLLGLFTIAVLERGMKLADLGDQLAQILVGVLLLVALGANAILEKVSARRVA